jgi:hypothetical protein
MEAYMNIKRFLAGGLAIFVIFQVCDFVIHSIILGDVYMSMMNVWRPDMMSLMWIMYVSSFVFSFLMMYVFVKGYEGRGIPEGVRFGILIGLMTNGMGAFYQYAVYPLPFSLIMQWFGYGLVEFIIAGIAAAAIYRPLACYGEDTL